MPSPEHEQRSRVLVIAYCMQAVEIRKVQLVRDRNTSRWPEAPTRAIAVSLGSDSAGRFEVQCGADRRKSRCVACPEAAAVVASVDLEEAHGRIVRPRVVAVSDEKVMFVELHTWTNGMETRLVQSSATMPMYCRVLLVHLSTDDDSQQQFWDGGERQALKDDVLSQDLLRDVID